MSDQKTSLRQKLAALLADRSNVTLAPGAYDALMARLIEATGFEALHITGGGISRSLGYPDVGVLTMNEMIDRIGHIVESVNIPVVADADTGYGSAYNIQRTVRELEKVGAASFHIEDETHPKKCMLLQTHGIEMGFVPVQAMVDRIKACVDARTDPGMLIVARIGLRLVASIEQVIEAVQRYEEAGADSLFMVRLSKDELKRVCSSVRIPVMFNIAYVGSSFGHIKDDLLSATDLSEAGCSMAIASAGAAIAGLSGIKKVLRYLREHGEVKSFYDMDPDAQEMADFYLLRGVKEVEAIEQKYSC